MNEDEKIKKEAEWLLESLKREKLIEGAIKQYKEGTYLKEPSIENSQAQIEGNFVVVHLRDDSYSILKTYRVFNNSEYKEQND